MLLFLTGCERCKQILLFDFLHSHGDFYTKLYFLRAWKKSHRDEKGRIYLVTQCDNQNTFDYIPSLKLCVAPLGMPCSSFIPSSFPYFDAFSSNDFTATCFGRSRPKDCGPTLVCIFRYVLLGADWNSSVCPFLTRFLVTSVSLWPGFIDKTALVRW